MRRGGLNSAAATTTTAVALPATDSSVTLRQETGRRLSFVLPQSGGPPSDVRWVHVSFEGRDDHCRSGVAGAGHALVDRTDSRRAWYAALPAVPRGARDRVRRDGVLLGRRADLLEAPWRLRHGRRLHGWLDQEPHLRGDLHRAHRAHRDRDGRLRPRQGRLRPADEGVLGEPRPDHRQPPGQRRRHPVPLGDLHHHRRPACRRPRLPRPLPKALAGAGYGAITTQIAPADEAGDGTFYYAEDYHQGYLHKHPGGYCNHGFCQIGYDLAAHGQERRGPCRPSPERPTLGANPAPVGRTETPSRRRPPPCLD